MITSLKKTKKNLKQLYSWICFLLNEHPSVSLALPPVGWQRTVAHPTQATTVWACENTVEILKQPGHLTSMKYEFGCCTRRLTLLRLFSSVALGCSKSRARGIVLCGASAG